MFCQALEEAQQAIKLLFEKINDIKQKADKSEQMVRSYGVKLQFSIAATNSRSLVG